jgi:ankyrin repeat protein
MMSKHVLACALLWSALVTIGQAVAQMPPSEIELRSYGGLHAAAARGSVDEIRQLAAAGHALDARDGNARTPLHVAAFQGHVAAARALLAAGADPNLLDRQLYDAVTVAAVRDDVRTVKALLSGGASARLITSPYHGTALIAAAHLGHHDVVVELIKAGAPLNHVNNLGWTALMEAVVLGDGGPRHVATVRALLDGGADRDIPDRQALTPLHHARARGYVDIIALLERSPAR